MSCLALATLPVFFLAPGYAAASATGLISFQQQSWIERLLWACALSLPLSLFFSVHPGLDLSPHLTTAFFAGIAVLALALALRDRKHSNTPLLWERNATILLAAAIALVPYVLLSALPIEVHGKIYESALSQDWNIRIQLVNAAIRGGNAPGNPMFAPNGLPAPLHYYYFWYVLCARMHDLVPVSARAIFTASCVGVALALLSFLLLAIKYLSPSRIPIRRQCTAALLAACILGLDPIAFIVTTLHHRFYSDLQFWLDDRSPGFLNMVLWSPHHAAGLVCCGLGTLLFVHSLEIPLRRQALHAALAGICFAASAGTSTFITLLFACACLAIFLDALRRRQWPVPRAMIAAALLATVLVAPYLRRVLLAPSVPLSPATAAALYPAAEVSLATGAHKHLLAFSPRYTDQARNYLLLTIEALDKHITHPPAPSDPHYRLLKWLTRIFRPPYMAGLFLFDFGFFLFVLIYEARKDLQTLGPLSRPSRILWLIFAGIALPGFFLTSGTLQGNNDLGRHAGFCLRLVLVLWSAPLIADFFSKWRRARQTQTRLRLSTVNRWAVAFALIGLLGQAMQIVLVRVAFPLTDAGLLPRIAVEQRIPRIAFRFGQMQQALSAAAHITPPLGIVQGNPHSRIRNILLLYTDRQMAAFDDGCNVPFGGNPNACLPLSRSLIQLFGGMGPYYQGGPKVFAQRIAFNPAFVTPANFFLVCSTYRLNTLVATYADPVWWDKQSWVWQLQPSFANSTARVFPCAQPPQP